MSTKTVGLVFVGVNLQHTSVGFAYTLFNLAPLLVIPFGAWLGHESFNKGKAFTTFLVVLAPSS
jgi:drug/metabolite transporter (DMT)-like permease